MDIFDVIITGAGPAGMMAAIAASSRGEKVLLLEKNEEPGRKLLITGNGRCNLTRMEEDVKKFVEAFGEKGAFLYSAFSRFGVGETIRFFQELGVETGAEEDGRVFPRSNKALDVRNALLDRIKKSGATVRTGVRVGLPLVSDGYIRGFETSSGIVRGKSYIICTGGKSYPKTGSTGDGYAMALSVGHSITELGPALSPVFVEDPSIAVLAGVSLKNRSVEIIQNRRIIKKTTGEILFTHRGLSGPAILDVSGFIGKAPKKAPVFVNINATSFGNEEEIREALISLISRSPRKTLGNLDLSVKPRRLWEYIIIRSGADPGNPAGCLAKKIRENIIRNALCLSFPVAGIASYDLAMLTKGGVSLSEIEPFAMRSKIIKNLFFAGEILDLDGPTGGYNLQMCWSTGFIAGNSAVKDLPPGQC